MSGLLPYLGGSTDPDSEIETLRREVKSLRAELQEATKQIERARSATKTPYKEQTELLREQYARMGIVSMRDAADTIDALLLERAMYWKSFDDQEQKIRVLWTERDSARAEVCLLRASSTNVGENASADMAAYAKSRGWDCFREERHDGDS